MGRDTSIAWCDATVNESFGCRMVDRACGLGEDLSKRGCYMFRMRKAWGQKGTDIVRFDLDKIAARIKSWPPEKHRIFLDDMNDLYGEFNDFDRIEAVHRVIIEGNPDRIFQTLTKRIGRAMVFYRTRPVPENVWVGCSVGERPRLRRLDQLREIKANQVRLFPGYKPPLIWVSHEPVVEDLGEFSLKAIDWAVVGGESGLDPRPMKPEWAESIRRICQRDGVAFFFKQMGGKGGGGAGGDLLNGVRYQEWPA